MPQIEDVINISPDDVGDGCSVVIKDGGTYKEFDNAKGDGTDRKLFLTVILPNGKERGWYPNKTSRTRMVKAFGDNTDTWKGVTVPLVALEQMVGSKQMKVIYVPDPESFGVKTEKVA